MRTRANKILLNIYLVLGWVLPTAGLLLTIFMIKQASFNESIWTKITRILFIFVTMPVYLIYARLIIIEIFPKKLLYALLFFVPYVLTFFNYYQHIHDNLLNFIALDSIPLFSGINLVLFLGLINLVYKKNKGATDVGIVILLTLVIASLYLIPVIYFIVYGHYLNTLLQENYVPELIKYYLNILLVALFNVKVIKALYIKGVL
jgi:hypothetical protein